MDDEGDDAAVATDDDDDDDDHDDHDDDDEDEVILIVFREQKITGPLVLSGSGLGSTALVRFGAPQPGDLLFVPGGGGRSLLRVRVHGGGECWG